MTSFLFLLVHIEYNDQALISMKGKCRVFFLFFVLGFVLFRLLFVF